MSNNYTNQIELHELIKRLRTSRGLTQNQLAELLGYSVRQVRRIESGEFELSREVIELLSKTFNIDMHQYKSISSRFKTIECYEEFINLQKAIECMDFEYIKASCERLKNNPEFQDGEKLQLILYSEATIEGYVNKDYLHSNEICLKALDIFGYTDYMSSLKNGILNEMSYPLLFSISYNFNCLGNIDHSFDLMLEIYNHFKNFVFKNPVPVKNDMYHMKKYYIGATNNLAHIYYEAKDYDKALELIDDAISLSNQFSVSIFTHYLIQTKFEIYYAKCDIENAKKFYKIFEYSCEIKGKNDYFNSIQQEIRSKCSLIFE